ncbi:GreA/GreB family elongation factor [Malaciobacter mytili]|uniref:Transcription elongation factor GreA n=1 Tax=Malaciobacter mytili LMG 24559 TaxID=1032238 RepID=A0AAX2AFC6_9BACT|nr:transcription elongation factor GreA [Malaciobacter mytili]AXH15335.1 transcription elongation factor GreB [Malaciobacter mytili LMG 24559]RXI43628.1 transcription elongation factor GreA [Malaciobacter mytili]RXK15729.1 transcription elongation factor GreA [Malaciobacter mytili LMG 24559]
MKKDLITIYGYKNFLDEFNHLLKVEKPFWVKEKEIAAQFGDRSENAEYISAKEQIRNIDKRLRFLDKIIQNSEVVNIDEIPHDRVNFGSKVTLVDLNTQVQKEFIIVGTYETNPNKNQISNKSPLGRELMGKKVFQEVEFSINEEIFEYEIIKIEKYNFKEE